MKEGLQGTGEGQALIWAPATPPSSRWKGGGSPGVGALWAQPGKVNESHTGGFRFLGGEGCEVIVLRWGGAGGRKDEGFESQSKHGITHGS